MKHGKKLHRLSRPAEHRKALLNNLALALITNKKIETTDAKAKALKPFIDRLISTARQDTLQARRQVAKSLHNKEAVKELFNVIVPKLEGRTSGFSRILKYRTRRGDGASLSIIELLLEKEVEDKSKKKTKKKTAPKKTTKASKPKAEKKEAVIEEEKPEEKSEVTQTEPEVETKNTEVETEEPETETKTEAEATEAEDKPDEPEDKQEVTPEEKDSDDQEKKE